MKPNELFEEKQHLIFAAIKKQFRNFGNARRTAEINNMELDDLIQVASIALWELCLKYDPKKEDSFHSYAITRMRWRMSDEIHRKGKLIRMTSNVTWEEREQFSFQSIDLYIDEGKENGFWAVSDIDVEEEAIKSVHFEETMNVLDEKEKYILMQKGYGISDANIAKGFGISRPTLQKIKNNAILKINPNYFVTGNPSLLADSRLKKKNHLRQQVI
ncbi:sigma-70 family RNA polymerase sigma factor [Bacillus toyonensis]|uniref:sigma-70 family RNA polymerase sigma factor n=1 Tax=Bacillus toyonensis TaxID=155322 RepID=UPI002175D8F8|nr:sigma-70 family RNA polymerase sigma factor [Bacillus toyonensis]